MLDEFDKKILKSITSDELASKVYGQRRCGHCPLNDRCSGSDVYTCYEIWEHHLDNEVTENG